jgi:hypothetical protein
MLLSAQPSLYQFSNNSAVLRFDPTIGEDMFAVFQMKGPRIKNIAEVNDVVENVHLYNMFCTILRISSAPNNGTLELATMVIL